MPTQVIATCFALASFVAASLLGVVAGNSMLTILWRATAIMAAAWLVGLVIGAIAQRTVEDHLHQTSAQDDDPRQEPGPPQNQGSPAVSANSQPSSDDRDKSHHHPHDPAAFAPGNESTREAA